MRAPLAAARAAQQAGDPAAAAEICARHPAQDGAVLALLALCLLLQGDTAAGAAALSRAHAAPPSDPAGKSDLGAACLLAGAASQAREILVEVAAMPGADAVAFNRLGTATLALSDLDGAAEAFRAALGLRPDWAVALSNLAGVEMRRLRPDRAVGLYERALALEPDNTGFQDNRNAALAALSRGDEALGPLEAALSASPGDPVLHRRLADVHAALDQDHQAEAHLRAAIETAPDDRSLVLRLARLLMRGNRPADALRVLERAGPVPALAQLRALACAELGQPDEATRILDAAPSRRSDDAEALQARGQVALMAGDVAAAEAAFRAASAAAPDLPEPRLGLGEALMISGRIDEAVAIFSDLAHHTPAALAALAEARAFPDDPAQLDRMRRHAESPQTPRPLRSALDFGLARIHDRRDAADRAFHHAQLANRAERAAIDHSAARASAATDRIIENFPPSLFARVGGGADSARPIFVCGMPRSGTTLVEQLLATHPRVHGAGELGLVPRIAAGLHGALGTALPYPRCMALFTDDSARDAADRYLAALGRIDASAAHVVDKLPHNFRHVGLIALMVPRAAIVHLRRDPRDVALSTYFMNFRQKRGAMAYAFDLDEIAAAIADHDRLMAHWHRVLPGRIIEVDYTALVTDFEPQARALLARLGLDWTPEATRFHRLDRPVRTGSVWQVRQPVHAGSVGRWRRYAAHLGAIPAPP